MASLDRAYGTRGALIALGMASIAGAVHGVMAGSFDYLGLKIVVGVAGALVLIMAGAISARRSILSAIAIGFGMGLLFFLTRWSGWSLITGGVPETLRFLSAGPWGWPGFLASAGISGFWIVEAISMLVPAMIGCIVGQEREA